MRRIAIGNDFRVSWTLTQLGEAFNVVGKTFDIEVSTAYGVIVVNDVVSEGNVLSFNVPASGQVYTGNYDIRLHITDEQTGQKWRLEQCDAFALVPCGACSDNVEVVQLSSGIVYPSNGLNAYQLAVLNGEYTGDYEGYQKWLARDADATAAYALEVANEAKKQADDAIKSDDIKTYNGVSIVGDGDIESLVSLTLTRIHTISYNNELDKNNEAVTTLNYNIDGELSASNTYYFRLMRQVRKNASVGLVKPSRLLNWRKNGWVAVDYRTTFIKEDVVRQINIEDNNTRYLYEGKSGVIKRGDGITLQPYELLGMFTTLQNGLSRFPTGKCSRESFEDLDDPKYSFWVSYKHLGIALWQYDDKGKPLRRVSNIARIGVSYCPAMVKEEGIDSGAVAWAIL